MSMISSVGVTRQASRVMTAYSRGSRYLHTSAPRYGGNPFFMLASLSNARETQHLAKLSKLSRVEHSPNLQLIKSSEVLPFEPPAPSETTVQAPQQLRSIPAKVVPVSVASKSQKVVEKEDLLSVGRAILADKDNEIAELRQKLLKGSEQYDILRSSTSIALSKAREEIAKLDGQRSAAEVWKWFLLILLSATGVWVYETQYARPVDTKSISMSTSPINATPVALETTSKPVSTPSPSLSIPSAPAMSAYSQATPAMPPQSPTSMTVNKISSWPNIFWAR